MRVQKAQQMAQAKHQTSRMWMRKRAIDLARGRGMLLGLLADGFNRIRFMEIFSEIFYEKVSIDVECTLSKSALSF